MAEDIWGPLRPYLVVLVGAIATYMWRALGVALSDRIRADSALLDLIGCIAYALLAGLVARLILLPAGPLQAASLGARLVAAVAAIAVFFVLKRNLLAGVIAGAATLSVLLFAS